MKKKLLQIFNSNPKKFIAANGFFMHYPVIDYIIHHNSALVWGESDHVWGHVLASTEDQLNALLKKCKIRPEYYYSVEDWMIPILAKGRSIDWLFKTDRYVLETMDNIFPIKHEMISLDESFTERIYEHSSYKDFISIDYINDRLASDISAGIMMEGQLVAWGFTHDDGALGFLHVIDAYRNKGLASDILSNLILQRSKANKKIFVNIVEGNTASRNLILKFGFSFDIRVSWMKLIN